MTMGGPSRAELSIQATCVGHDMDDARKIGGALRHTFGKDRHGKFLNAIAVDGFAVIDITTSAGHGDNSGGVATWVEIYDVAYQAYGETVTVAP
jgi:hypothetical protein